MTRLILSGGRIQDALIPVLLKKVNDKRVLYLPLAKPVSERIEYGKYFLDEMKLHGFTAIDVWTTTEKKHFVDIQDYGAIYIPGGNTFSLLYELRNTGFIDILRLYAKKNGLVYGSSAGAIIFSKTVEAATIGNAADENTTGITNVSGLDMLTGHLLHCHYTLQDDDALVQLSTATRSPIIALPEGAGVLVEDKSIMVIGELPVTVFSGNEKREVQPYFRVA
jgi:dipeptidase E